MKFTKENKRKIVEEYDGSIDVETYTNQVNVSKGSFYKWVREFGNSHVKPRNRKISLTDVTANFKQIDSSNEMKLSINNVSIVVDNRYDESLLLRLISTLKKL